MASTQTNSFLQNLYLSPEQEKQLLAVLATQQNGSANSLSPPSSNHLSMSPSSFSGSPQQRNTSSFRESPYLDNYDYSFGDSSYDLDASDVTAQMIGDLPGTTKSDSPDNEGSEKEKRAHPDDDEDEANKSGAKRRESTEKVPKKPGRKPLTSEPTSKRKAQNRAAQRAFRERKEKHLKDLEDKVVELEKKTEATTSENSQLRAQLEAVTAELNEYKRKIQTTGNGRSVSGGRLNTGFGHAAINNLGDVNFQFEFPKFGILPGPLPANKPTRQNTSTSAQSPSGSNAASPSRQTNNERSSGASPSSMGSLSTAELASFSAVFQSSQNGTPAMNGTMSRGSLDSGHFGLGGAAATSSPSASSNSNMGPSSSCGTSPEPFNQSPMGFKPLDTMTTIGEEPTSLTTGNLQSFNHFGGMDTNGGFDWLAQQNGGQFDPQLFGDYREPQDHILANTNLDDLFADMDADFLTPYNMPAIPGSAMPKKNLIAEIDAKQNADDEPVETRSKKDKYPCTEVWEKLQNCEKVKSGDIDLDGLCSELQKKAKCSGTGPVVKDQDFHDILKKYLGDDLSKACDGTKAKATIP